MCSLWKQISPLGTIKSIYLTVHTHNSIKRKQIHLRIKNIVYGRYVTENKLLSIIGVP